MNLYSVSHVKKSVPCIYIQHSQAQTHNVRSFLLLDPIDYLQMQIHFVMSSCKKQQLSVCPARNEPFTFNTRRAAVKGSKRKAEFVCFEIQECLNGMKPQLTQS